MFSNQDDIRTPVGCVTCAIGVGVFIVLPLLCCGGGLYWWLRRSAPSVATPPVAVSPLAQLQAKHQTWVQERQRLGATLEKLEADQRSLVEKLRAAGVASAKDLADDPQHRVLATELLELERQTRAVRNKIQAYDTALARLESLLRRAERQEMLSESAAAEEELGGLKEATLELEHKLQPDSQLERDLQDLEMEEVLEQQLQAPQHEKADEA